MLADSPTATKSMDLVQKPRQSVSAPGSGTETAIVDCSLLTVTLETGSGVTSLPLVKFQSKATCTLNGFLSSKLTAEGEFSIEAVYFNPSLGVWEPLLEPIPKMSGLGLQHSPVRVGVRGEMEMGGHEASGRRGSNFSSASVISPSPSYASIEKDIAQDFERLDAVIPPVMTLSLDFKDPLEFTVSRSFLRVWRNLSESYLAAYNRKEPGSSGAPSPPYIFYNHTGYSTVVQLKDSDLQLHPPQEAGSSQHPTLQGMYVCVKNGAQVPLYDAAVKTTCHKRRVSLVHQHEVRNTFLHVGIPELSSSDIMVPLNKACTRFFPVGDIGQLVKQKGGVVSKVQPRNTTREIMLSSCVKVTNTLKQTVEVYFMTERGNEVELVEKLAPEGTCLLPLHAVHTPTAELFFCVSGYSVSRTPVVWRGLQNQPNKLQMLSCVPRNAGAPASQVTAQNYNFVVSFSVLV